MIRSQWFRISHLAIAARPASAFLRLKSLFVKSWDTFLRVGRDKVLVTTPPRFYTSSYDTVNGAPYSRIDLFARNGKTKVHLESDWLALWLSMLRNDFADPSVSKLEPPQNQFIFLFIFRCQYTPFRRHIYIYTCVFINYFYLESLFTFYAWVWNTMHLLIILNEKLYRRLSHKAKPLFIKEALMLSNFSPRLFLYDLPLAKEQYKQVSDIERYAHRILDVL